jgi:hypothetical protein
MTDKKELEENCIQQQVRCESDLPIQTQGSHNDSMRYNPMKTVIV